MSSVGAAEELVPPKSNGLSQFGGKKDGRVVVGVELLWGAWFQTRQPTTRKRGKGSRREGDKKKQRIAFNTSKRRGCALKISLSAL